MINKLDLQVDLIELRRLTEQLMNKYDADQICLTHTIQEQSLWQGCGSLHNHSFLREEDFTVFNEDFKDTYFFDVYKMMPGKIGRMRLMRLQPRRCYTYHFDMELRYHIAIDSNSSCFFIIDGITYQIPSDTYIYKVDTTKQHTALNANSSLVRTHLVMCSLS